MNKTLIVLFFAIIFYSCKPIKPAENIFDFWWNEMDCKYPFFEEKNIDWDSVYSVYYQRTRTADETHLQAVFQEIINLLKDAHCFVSTSRKLIYYKLLPKDTIDKFRYYDITEYTDSFKSIHNKDSTMYIFQLRNNIVYINYPSFEFRVIKIREVCSILNQFSYSGGIIFDIRFNGGGQPQNIGEWISLFFSGTKTLWYNKHKIGCGHNDFTDFIPQNSVGKGIIDENIQVAVLANGYTYSAANYFSGVTKQFSNIVLIGTKTGGGGSWITTSILPNGWKFRHPVAQAYDIKCKSIEHGVEPNIKVAATPQWYAKRYDIVLETAYNYLTNR